MRATIVCLTLAFILAALPVPAAASLRVGATRMDITPGQADIPAPYTKAHDPIYLRTILVEDGAKRVVVVVADVPMIEGSIYDGLVEQISREAACPPENVVLAITHTHNSIRVDTSGVGKRIPFSLAFNAKLKEAISKSLEEAKSKLQPARAGFGRGKAYLAANRNVWNAMEARYAIGVDRTGREPFDPTVAVLRFDNMAGEPIAFLINYGFEPVVYLSASEISGDVPGAVSRYIEERYGDKAVAAFTIGPAGNPAYSAGGGQMPGLVKPSTQNDILTAMGTLMGEEVLAVSRDIHDTSDALPLATALKTVTCPGKITTPLNLPRECAYTPDSNLPPCRDYKDQPTEPVAFRLGLLRIGDVAFVHTDSNVAPALGLKLTEASPLAGTVVTADNFGPAWFIVDDAAYAQNTYEATASRLQSGCGEQAFLNGALEMIRDSGRK
jgi:neutral ceramidase